MDAPLNEFALRQAQDKPHPDRREGIIGVRPDRREGGSGCSTMTPGSYDSYPGSIKTFY